MLSNINFLFSWEFAQDRTIDIAIAIYFISQWKWNFFQNKTLIKLFHLIMDCYIFREFKEK